MTLAEMTVRTALRALARNPLRAVLTTLGVVIGTAAVIAMVSVGQGADAAVQAQIANMGPNVVMVVSGGTTAGGVRSGSGTANTVSVSDGEAIGREVPSAIAVAWMKREIRQLVYGNKNWATAVQASPPSYTDVRDWPVARGRFFTPGEEESAAKVVVLGLTTVAQLYAPGEDPLGTSLRIQNVPFTVIGVLSAKGDTSWGQDQDDIAMVPFRTGERRVFGTTSVGMVGMLLIATASPDDAVGSVRPIRDLLRVRHRIQPGAEDDFTVRTMTEMYETSLAASQVMTRLLAAIASMSLLVGGIGIMNTLLVSVTERTREIGIRLAVGAKARHILAQFLIESTVLSLLGGVLGTALGIGAAGLVGQLAEWPILVSPRAVMLAFGFSAAVGIIFGVYPAQRAARLDPITALRRE